MVSSLHKAEEIMVNKMNKKTMLILFLTLSFLTACAQTATPGGYPPPGSVSTSTSAAGYPPPGSIETPTSNSPYPNPTEVIRSTQVTVDLAPQAVAAVQEVSKKYGIPVDQILVTSMVAVTWPNGCLGVVIPGFMCTDVVTPGYRIILSANGQQYEIHTNQNGSNVVDAAQQLATLGFVVQLSDHSIQVVNPNIPLGPTYNPAFNGFLPLGGAILGKAYVLDLSQFKALRVDVSEQKDLSFIKTPNYALAIWRGGFGTQPLLAWGTQPTGDSQTSSLQIANLDGSNPQILLTVEKVPGGPIQLVAELFSMDGKSLYFSKEPVGIGGYILFSGASNLYKIDLATKNVTEIIPQTPSTSPQICLDAISGDYRFVADHCTQGVITIRNLQSGTSTAVKAPTDIKDYKVIGSARFSPAGDQVAFALAKNDPNNEQGWVAVGSSSGGEAKKILVSDTGSYFTIQGWLDDQTLLVQLNPVSSTTVGSQLFTVTVEGKNLAKVADGSLLTIIDNR
jgi:hypothetical protein